MRLDRNLGPLGKYIVFRSRDGSPMSSVPFDENEVFVIALKDKHAEAALRAYAESADEDDSQYAAEVRALADRAGPNNPYCKRPD